MKYTIKDIVTNDLCVGCGICTSASKSSKMNWNDDGFLVPILDDSFSENAIKLCPFNPNPENEVKDEDVLADALFPSSKQKDFKIGRFENTYAGYSNEYRNTSSSGGIATFIFEKILKDKIVDHLFIVKEVNGSYQYQWFNSIDRIKQISKTRYIPVTLEKLFKEIDEKDGKVAVSGVACFIKAIRLKQHYNPQYKDKIPFIIGIICGGLKSNFFTEYLAQKSGIKGDYHNQEYRIKDKKSVALDYSFGAFDDKRTFHQLKMSKVGDMWGTGYFKANACDFCTDVGAELADISLGDAWIDPYKKEGMGNSVVITRSKLADTLVKQGLNDKDLTLEILTLENFKSSQSGSFNHRQLSVKYRLEYFKKKGVLTPYVREKHLKDIPFEFERVQNKRIELRKESLNLWKEYKNSKLFDQSIKESCDDLRKRTIFYHRVQKIKGILGLKKMKI